MEIKLKEIQNKGFAIATLNGEKAGEMTYSIPNSDFIIIDHTEVREDFNGKGVGKNCYI